MGIRRKVSSILFAGILLAGLPNATLAKPAKKVVDYVALGDSLAAGQTPYKEIKKGYPDYLVDRFEQSQYTVGFKNFGIPGYNSEQLKNDVLFNDKVRKSIAEAEVITIDIGANDLLRVLNDPAQVKGAMIRVTTNLEYILKTVDALNPDVNVYVMGYYYPFPYLSEKEQAYLVPLMNALNQAIQDRSAQNGDSYVSTEKTIAKHYEDYLPNPQDIHLSLEGYQVLAKEFWKAIVKNQ